MLFWVLYLVILFISVILLYGWILNFFYKLFYKKIKK